MPHDWVLEVLADLRRYARENGLPGLAEQMGTAVLTAEREISPATPPGRRSGPDTGDGARTKAHAADPGDHL